MLLASRHNFCYSILYLPSFMYSSVFSVVTACRLVALFAAVLDRFRASLSTQYLSVAFVGSFLGIAIVLFCIQGGPAKVKPT